MTVGTRAGALDGFWLSFQNAVKTSHVAHRFGCHAEVDFYDDWQTNMLPLYAPYPEIEAFVQKWMGPVLDNQELLDTLNIYIITKGNQQRTIEILHIHKSTLKYRLKRISELVGCDLHDLHSIVSLQMAVIYNWYLKGMQGVTLEYTKENLEMRRKENLK